MLILLPCLFTQIGACFPHVVSCLPARPAAEGHHRSPHHRRQSRTAFTSPSPSLQDLFQQLQLKSHSHLQETFTLKKKSLFFPSPTHPKRVCHRADSKLFQLACQTDHKQPRPMGIQRSLTRWERTLYFELCLKGDRTYLLRKKGICGKAYRLFYCVHPSSCVPRPSP